MTRLSLHYYEELWTNSVRLTLGPGWSVTRDSTARRAKNWLRFAGTKVILLPSDPSQVDVMLASMNRSNIAHFIEKRQRL